MLVFIFDIMLYVMKIINNHEKALKTNLIFKTEKANLNILFKRLSKQKVCKAIC
jgi:hypothetical protein